MGRRYTGPVSSIHLYSALNSAPPSRSWMSSGLASATGTSCRYPPKSPLCTHRSMAAAGCSAMAMLGMHACMQPPCTGDTLAPHRLAAPEPAQLREPSGAGEGCTGPSGVDQLLQAAVD